jgi:hypothetical protein
MPISLGEKTTSIFSQLPLASLNKPNGLCTSIVDVDTTDFAPGWYSFSGNFMIAVWIGHVMYTHHIDIGTSLTPETAPAGGAGLGNHDPVQGDAGPGGNAVTLLKPVGTRLIKIDNPGIQHVYLRAQVYHNGANIDGTNACYGSGCLNWHKIAEL